MENMKPSAWPISQPASPRHKQKTSSRKDQKKDSNTEVPAPAIKPLSETTVSAQAGVCPESVTHQKLAECADFLNKIKSLQFALELDLLACDAKWTLFVAAAFSYRYDSMLQPFPPYFASEQMGNDIEALLVVIKDVPKLSIVLQNLIEEAYHEVPGAVIELLYWVLIAKAEPFLRLVTEEDELNSLLNCIDNKPFKGKPSHVFKVNANKGFHYETEFNDRTQNLPLKLAFMGNKLDVYYSMLLNGVSQTVENTTVWRLSTDLHTSLVQSPFCAAWGASQCGSIISCTAICEFAFDAECDQIVANENDNSCVDICLSRPDNIRLRYLIFYGRRFPRNLLPSHGFFSWIYNYRCSLSLLSYVLIIVTIGVANSEKGEFLKLYVSSKFELFLSFCRRFIADRFFLK